MNHSLSFSYSITHCILYLQPASHQVQHRKWLSNHSSPNLNPGVPSPMQSEAETPNIYTNSQRPRPPEDQEPIQHRRLASDRMLSAISNYRAHSFPSHICACTNVCSGWVESPKDVSDNFRRDGKLSHEGLESWESQRSLSESRWDV
jgi:hypothetical protein